MHNRTSSTLISLIFCRFNQFKRIQPLWASVSIKLASSFDIHPSNLQKHISLGWRQGSLVSPFSQDVSLRSRILSIFPLFFQLFPLSFTIISVIFWLCDYFSSCNRVYTVIKWLHRVGLDRDGDVTHYSCHSCFICLLMLATHKAISKRARINLCNFNGLPSAGYIKPRSNGFQDDELVSRALWEIGSL